MNINYFSKLCHWFAPTTIKSKLPRLICLNNNGGERLPVPLFQKSKYTNVHLYTNRMWDICCVVKRVCQGGLLNNKWLQILREIFIIQILCSVSQQHQHQQSVLPAGLSLTGCQFGNIYQVDVSLVIGLSRFIRLKNTENNQL